MFVSRVKLYHIWEPGILAFTRHDDGLCPRKGVTENRRFVMWSRAKGA